MELFNALNELEEIIENSIKVPMTRRVLVDEDRLLDMLDRIRTTLPEEIRQAKWIIQEREKVLAETKKEAGRIMEDVQKQMERRIDESEIARLAKIKAEETVERAENIAREIKQGAREYADEILNELEKKIEGIMAEIRNGRAELKGLKKTG
ncbi:MAG: ATPase [Peptococcaceae bacterium]|nr:ATPase [Peptococcaceae bacterium]